MSKFNSRTMNLRVVRNRTMLSGFPGPDRASRVCKGEACARGAPLPPHGTDEETEGEIDIMQGSSFELA